MIRVLVTVLQETEHTVESKKVKISLTTKVGNACPTFRVLLFFPYPSCNSQL
jgi:hypothetical protein